MTIGSLAVNITANSEKFAKGCKVAQNVASTFLKSVTASAAGATAALGGVLHMFDSTGSELNDMSKATGIAVENLDFLKYAAGQSSASLNQITKAARTLQQAGVDPNKFESIAAGIASIKNPVQQAQAAMEAFGTKAGSALLPMIQDLPELRKRFEQLGGGFTEKMAKSADALGDSLGDLKLALRNISFAVADQIAPAVTKFTNLIAENGKLVRDWVSDHGSLVKAIAYVGATVSIITPVLWSMNTAVTTLITSLGLLKAAASSGVLLKLLSVLGPLAVGAGAAAVTVGAAKAAYDTNVGDRPGRYGAGGGWEEDTAKSTAVSAKELSEQTSLLREIAGQRGAKLEVAGVR